MIKQLLTAMAISLPCIAISQVSLNATMAPPVNSMFIYYDANVPSPPFTFGTSGTSNLWDFSSLTPVMGADDTTYVAEPSSVPGGASFPSATHCTFEDGQPSYTMMQINSSGVTFLGSVSDLSGSGNYMPLIAVPPLQAMSFPYVYGSSVSGSTYFEVMASGASIGQPNLDSVHYKSTISGQRNVIASGDMILPMGTLPAILERSIDSTIDTLWVKGAQTGNQWVISPGFPQTSTDSAFYWYTNQSLLAYAHALYDNTGLHDVNYFKNRVTGVKEINTQAGFAYPNPVNNILYISLPVNTPASYDIRIMNAQGQEVMKGKTSVNQLNVSLLQPGIYHLELWATNGNKSVIKFVKN